TAFCGTVYLVSPMKFSHEEAAQYEWFARQGWEVSVGSMGSLGGTTPITPAGALALQLAEGLVLQIMRRCFFGHMELNLGNSLSVIDVRTGAFQYGRPEQTLLNLAGAQIARQLGARYNGHGGLSDAREPGFESAMQKTASALINGISSGHGHVAAGLLAVDEVFSPEQLLLDAEMLSYLKRLSMGFSTEIEDFALDTVLEAGWGGHFLDKDHTVEHFRQSLWSPVLFSTQSYSMWHSSGGRSAMQGIRERAKEAMDRIQLPSPSINSVLEKKLLKIIREAI
ncbi:MAG: trimethylamine methyltransferase family protein, partial [Anaerolineaceae bacterium]